MSPHTHVPRSIAKLLIYPFCVNTHFPLIGTALLPQILVLTSLTIPLPQPVTLPQETRYPPTQFTKLTKINPDKLSE